MLGRIFDEIKPTVIFCIGDRHIDIEVPTLLAARSRKIKVVIPFTTSSDAYGMLKIRQVQKEPKRWWPVSLCLAAQQGQDGLFIHRSRLARERRE